MTVLFPQPVARGHLEDQEGDGMIILRWGLGKYVVKMEETEMTTMAHLVGQLEVFNQLLLMLDSPSNLRQVLELRLYETVCALAHGDL